MITRDDRGRLSPSVVLQLLGLVVKAPALVTSDAAASGQQRRGSRPWSVRGGMRFTTWPNGGRAESAYRANLTPPVFQDTPS